MWHVYTGLGYWVAGPYKEEENALKMVDELRAAGDKYAYCEIDGVR